MLRTGVILPRSNLFPSLGLDILNSIKENCKAHHTYEDFTFFTDNIGFGFDEAEIYAKVEKMLLQDEADVIVLCADVRISEMLQPMFDASNKLLLVVNAGANFPENWRPGATTITHTLNFCQQASLTGRLAATESGKNVVNTTSYYDAGYRQCFCMLNSNQLAGGQPLLTHVTSSLLTEFTLEPVDNFLQTHGDVHTMLCLFTADQAAAFFKHIEPIQQKFATHLYVSPMMLEASLKKSIPAGTVFKNVKGYVPWHLSLTNHANSGFIKKMGERANYFTLLGWETGTILIEVLEQYKKGNTSARAIVEALKEICFESPRGWLSIHKDTQYSYGPSYLASYNDIGEISLDEKSGTGEEEWLNFVSQAYIKGDYSGWRNNYLCI
jgi:branched-chain amino acid transport system substrate-binding protein